MSTKTYASMTSSACKHGAEWKWSGAGRKWDERECSGERWAIHRPLTLCSHAL